MLSLSLVALSTLLSTAALSTTASSTTALSTTAVAAAAVDETAADDTVDGTADEDTVDGAADPGQSAEAEAVAEQLRLGQQVYSQICSSCHQPGGVGLSGLYPPLADNPNTEDGDYIRDVIANGRRGQIQVGDETYDGVMPSFSTLADDEVDAIIAYIQAGFVAPAAEVAVGPVGPVAGTELPALTNFTVVVAYLLAAGVAALVLAPRLLSENSRLNTPWLDAWLKTAVIVIAVVFLTVAVPDWAMKQGSVAKLSRFAQDVIGTGLWSFGLVVLLLGLWYAHRESRI